jgi:hypothetical protein
VVTPRTYPCAECGRFAFHKPTICAWCQDTRSEEEIAASTQAGIERAVARGRERAKERELERARKQIHRSTLSKLRSGRK